MLRSKSFFKKTRKGKIVKVDQEVYLRDDIYCGSSLCTKCYLNNKRDPSSSSADPVLSAHAPHYLLLDTNVILHQIDLLENPALSNVIIPQTVLEEVRHQNRTLHNRIRGVIADPARHFFVFYNELKRETRVDRLPSETPNDRNDRAIRVAAKWYSQHLLGVMPVILLTNDKACLQKALDDNLSCSTVHEYVKGLSDKYPELVDILVEPSSEQSTDDVDGASAKKKNLFPKHKTMAEMTEGLRNKIYYQGTLTMSTSNALEGWVRVEGLPEDVLIPGRENLNRGVHGDVVVIELLPKEEWKAPSRFVIEADDPLLEQLEIESQEAEAEETEKQKRKEESTETNQKKNKEKEQAVTEKEKEGSERQITGKIVGIMRRNWKPYIGCLELGLKPNSSSSSTSSSVGTQHLLFLPMDRHIPKIRIKTRQADTLRGKRIVVSIDDWQRDSAFPNGHYVRQIGDIGDKEAESEALLIQHDVPFHPFSQNVLACLPQLPWVITEQDMKQRMDLRNICVCSIDPPGCTDIDDALHVNPLANGNYEVGVHIADVSHFVKPNTAIDEEAASRGTTVYLCDRRIDMLPKLLGEDLCSLRSNVDRFAFSCIWEMTKEAEIVNVKFSKSVIRSRASLTYEEAQNRIDDIRMQDELTVRLRMLNDVAKLLRQKRMDCGALTLASPEIRFKKDEETHDPIDVEMYESRETNHLVEEFMLLANISVAKKIYSSFPTFSLLRRHPIPPEKNFAPLLNIAKKLGVKLNIKTSKELALSLDQSGLAEKDPYLDKLLRILTTRCMTQAVYFSSGTVSPEEFLHYGLATPIYTHFTSPIRRYADLVVHRLLGASIGIYPLSDELDKEAVHKLCVNLNHRHRMAQNASRASVELHTLIFFKGKQTLEEAYIVRVKANAFIVLVPRYGIEAIVYVDGGGKEKEKESRFTYDEEEQVLTDGVIKFRPFDKVQVVIAIDDSQPHRPQVAVKCVDPPLHALPLSGLLEASSSATSSMPLPQKERIVEAAEEKTKKRKKPEEDETEKKAAQNNNNNNNATNGKKKKRKNRNKKKNQSQQQQQKEPMQVASATNVAAFLDSIVDDNK